MGSQDFLHTFSMALYHIWDVKNGFPYVLTFFSLISDSLGSVLYNKNQKEKWGKNIQASAYNDANTVIKGQ